jgi:hypothetical protein
VSAPTQEALDEAHRKLGAHLAQIMSANGYQRCLEPSTASAILYWLRQNATKLGLISDAFVPHADALTSFALSGFASVTLEANTDGTWQAYATPACEEFGPYRGKTPAEALMFAMEMAQEAVNLEAEEIARGNEHAAAEEMKR